MTGQIIFATGNKRKITEARRAFENTVFQITPMSVEIDEIQHRNPTDITIAKARAAYEVIQHPLVVQDTSWSIPALGGFPGGYMKDIAEWWQAQDWMSIMAPYKDRRIICHEHVVYFDGRSIHHFEASYEGYFVDQPRGSVIGNNSLEQSITTNGTETFAEMHDRGNVASAAEDCVHWQLLVNWLKENNQ